MIYGNDWDNFKSVCEELGGLSFQELSRLVKEKKLEIGIAKETDIYCKMYITPESVERYKETMKQQGH